jgi:hypothetical protein
MEAALRIGDLLPVAIGIALSPVPISVRGARLADPPDSQFGRHPPGCIAAVHRGCLAAYDRLSFVRANPSSPAPYAALAIATVAFGTGVDGGTMLGNLLVLGASLAVAVYTLMAHRLLVDRSALHVTTYQHLFGALFVIPAVIVDALVVGAGVWLANSGSRCAGTTCPPTA